VLISSNNFRQRIPGAVLLYSDGLATNPATFYDLLHAFQVHSRYPVWPLNTFLGLPRALRGMRPDAIILHFSMFYDGFSPLTTEILDFLDRNRGRYLLVFFQDEQAYLGERIDFCRDFDVDCVHTMLKEPHASAVYGAARVGLKVVSALPGYVSDGLPALGDRFGLPDEARPVDVGYRGRRAPAAWGAAAQEKYEIGLRFLSHAEGSGLRLDIAVDEASRLYGDDWFRWLGRSKATLGTESGAEIVWPSSPAGRIPYRTISPRHFEAAACRTCQVLFEGSYSGLLESMVHYIPLRKDFADFDEAMSVFHDRETRVRIAANARRDLIDSDELTYRRYIVETDDELESAAGLDRRMTARQRSCVALMRFEHELRRRIRLARFAAGRARTRLDEASS
jgi:hypothetical protein